MIARKKIGSNMSNESTISSSRTRLLTLIGRNQRFWLSSDLLRTVSSGTSCRPRNRERRHMTTPSETVQCSCFNTRIRKPGESVATFVAELRSLAKHCNFGASLNEMLRDRIVCGIDYSKIRQKLMSD